MTGAYDQEIEHPRQIGSLGVADLAGVEDGFVGETEFGNGGNALGRVIGEKTILVWNSFRPSRGDLAPVLRGVVLIRQPALGAALDQQRVALGSVCRSAQFVVCLLGAVHPKAMPVILTTAAEIEAWLTVHWNEAAALQLPLPDGALRIVARGVKEVVAKREAGWLVQGPYA